MSGLFIADGYTCTKKLDAKPGLHPAVEVAYRPALAAKRNEYAARLSGDPAKLTAWESELIEGHVATLGGERLAKGQADRIVPALRTDVLNLILGYAGADEAGDAKN